MSIFALLSNDTDITRLLLMASSSGIRRPPLVVRSLARQMVCDAKVLVEVEVCMIQ